MITMKYIFAIFFIITLTNTYGQVNGISGSKLCVPEAGTVEKGKFEFEPSLSVFHSSNEFDSNWKLKPLNSYNDASSLQFRITLGVADGLEIGTSFSTNLGDIFIGSKALMFSGANYAMALIGGISLPADNQSPDDTINTVQNKHSFSLGSTYSAKLSDAASIDMLLSYSAYNGASAYKSALNYGASFGLWISNFLQGVAELNGYTTFNGSLYSDKLSITPGITYHFSNNLLLALGDQIDIMGKNDFSGTNIFCAFTMSF